MSFYTSTDLALFLGESCGKHMSAVSLRK